MSQLGFLIFLAAIHLNEAAEKNKVCAGAVQEQNSGWSLFEDWWRMSHDT